MTELKRECAKIVHYRDAWHPSRCVKPAKVLKNDKWWCTQHDPDVEKKRDEEARKRGEMRFEQQLAPIQAGHVAVRVLDAGRFQFGPARGRNRAEVLNHGC